MLPWPNCGKFCFVKSAGSRFDAVSSGGNRTKYSRNASRLLAWVGFSAAKALQAACASPPCRRITSVRVLLRPWCPYGPVVPTPTAGESETGSGAFHPTCVRRTFSPRSWLLKSVKMSSPTNELPSGNEEGLNCYERLHIAESIRNKQNRQSDVKCCSLRRGDVQYGFSQYCFYKSHPVWR
jgi:hypothetical protein